MRIRPSLKENKSTVGLPKWGVLFPSNEIILIT